MPTLDANRQHWEQYDWQRGQQGDEWSEAWGGAVSQWVSSIAPRVGALLPCGRVLEIAPGYGRWTQFLLEHCEELVGVDLAGVCVDACRSRFQGRRASFFENDGASVPMVPSASIDVAFSFDSLVHVDQVPVVSYIQEFARVLRPGGAAFLHHSNLAAVLERGIRPEQTHWRSPEVSASLVKDAAERSGLWVVTQELVNWGCSDPIDCMTLLRRPGAGDVPAPPVIQVNLDFMTEAELARRRALLWRTKRIAGRPAPMSKLWRRWFS